MGWDRDLFDVLDDLEGEASARFHAERIPAVLDRSRAEYRQVTLAGRLMASLEHELTVVVDGVGPVNGVLERMGAEWLFLRGEAQGDWLVRLGAVQEVAGASERAVPEMAWSPLTRLGFGSTLRRVADDGGRCLLHVVTGGAPREVRIGRVGGDFVEIGEGFPPRTGLVAFGAIAAVQSRE